MTPYTVAVIACSGAKLDHAAPAGQLYTGSLFRSSLLACEALQAAGQLDATVVLSALHGLVPLDHQLAPYDVTWGDPVTVAVEQLGHQVTELLHVVDHVPDDAQLQLLPMLPKAYAAQLDRAVQLAGVDVLQLVNPLADARGLLSMRRTLRELREAAQA